MSPFWRSNEPDINSFIAPFVGHFCSSGSLTVWIYYAAYSVCVGCERVCVLCEWQSFSLKSQAILRHSVCILQMALLNWQRLKFPWSHLFCSQQHFVMFYTDLLYIFCTLWQSITKASLSIAMPFRCVRGHFFPTYSLSFARGFRCNAQSFSASTFCSTLVCFGDSSECLWAITIIAYSNMGNQGRSLRLTTDRLPA